MSNQTIVDALRGRMNSLSGKADRIRDKAKNEERDLTAHEQGLLESIFAEFDSCDHELSQIQAVGLRDPDFVPPRMDVRPQNRAHWKPIAGLFDGRDDSGFPSFGHFVQALNSAVRGVPDSRLRAAPQGAFEESTGESGGFLVPAKFVSQILEDAIIGSALLDKVTKIPMPSGNVSIAGMDCQDHSSGSIAGLSLQWLGESQLISDQDPVLRTINLKAKKAAILVHCSNEVLEDAPTGDAQLRSIFASTLKLGLEAAMLSGNGVGRPLGILNSDALIAVSKETSQTADTLLFENLISMLSRLHPSMIRDAIWIASPSVLPQLLSLSFKIQNVAGSENVGGQRVDVGTDSAGVYRVLGIPIIFSENMASLGDQGDVLLCSPSQYILGITTALAIDVSPHTRFAYDQTSYRMKIRVDGQSLWSSAVTPAVGSNTLSPFVTVAARA